MPAAPTPLNEPQRLDTLWSYEILDTDAEAGYDAITQLAAELCDAPIALVSLVDRDRQWFKSQCGLGGGADSTGRDIAFCAYTILQGEMFEVADATQDPRFAQNPLVTGEPHIRFYAGIPLIEPGGMALGSLCVIDRRPRRLSAAQRSQLERLAQAIVELIVARTARSEADRRRIDLLDSALAQARERTAQLRSLVRLSEALVQVERPAHVVELALESALGSLEDSRGSIAGPDDCEVTAARTCAPNVARTPIATPSGEQYAIVLERAGLRAFTPADRVLLDLIGSIAGLALASAGAASAQR